MNKSFGIFIVLLIFQLQALAKSGKVSSAEEYKTLVRQLSAKDTVIWKNGNYADVELNVQTPGLFLLAETPGKVVFSGKSSVRIAADGVTFSGFQFINGSVTGNVLIVSGSHNRISHLNISDYRSHYYVEITKTGQYNEVARCNFEKKPQAPPGKEGTSVFQVAVDSLHPGCNNIRWCSFRDFRAPEGAGGDYGMEAFRVGYSYQCKFVSRTLMEYCYFTGCNGDGEIISNKARENVYRYNTFESNGESHLTLRHGSVTAVYGNFFLGGAGIRIKEGRNQMVYNNYFQTGVYFAVRLENYRADPLRDIIIAHNTIVGSGPVKLGGKGDFTPENVLICNNLFLYPEGKILEDPTGREKIAGNYAGDATELPGKGFTILQQTPENNEYGFRQPAKVLPSAKIRKHIMTDIPEMEDDPGILLDIAGNKRQRQKSAGCYEPVRDGFPVRPAATALNTGPSYLRRSP